MGIYHNQSLSAFKQSPHHHRKNQKLQGRDEDRVFQVMMTNLLKKRKAVPRRKL